MVGFIRCSFLMRARDAGLAIYLLRRRIAVAAMIPVRTGTALSVRSARRESLFSQLGDGVAGSGRIGYGTGYG